MKYKISNTLSLALLTTAIFFAYCFYLPNYMQGGDTSELVAAAYFNLIAHPPGYPLWCLLQSFGTHLITFKSIFWRASALNSLFASASLFFILYPLKDKILLSLALIVGLAFSTSFFQAAVLPDVFSLHVLIVSVICFLYLSKNIPSKVCMFGIPFFFFIGISNHHTIIFLLPLLIDTYYENRKDKKAVRWLVGGIFSGIFLTTLLYLTLLQKEVSSYYSWGNIDNVEKLWTHFTRADYGTFQLSADEKSSGFNFSSIVFFFRENAAYLLFFIIFTLLGTKKILMTRKGFCLMLSLFLSLIFLGMVNFPIEGMAKEVVTRFHVMPFILIVILVVCFFITNPTAEPQISMRGKVVLLLLAFFVSSVELFNNQHLAHDSFIEFYNKTLLNETQANGARVIFSANDNIYFGLRFVQLQNTTFRNIAVVSPPLLSHQWYVEKLEKHLPGFKIKNEKKIFNSKKIDLVADVLAPNVQMFSYIFPNNFQDSGHFKITYMSLGRQISAGQGIFFQENSDFHEIKKIQPKEIFRSFQGYSKKYLLADFSNYYLARGMNFYSQNKIMEASKEWQNAISIVPYCYPALKNYCTVTNFLEPLCSKGNLKKIKQESELIF